MNKHIETILVKHRFNYIEEIKVRQAKNAIFSYKIRVITKNVGTHKFIYYILYQKNAGGLFICFRPPDFLEFYNIFFNFVTIS